MIRMDYHIHTTASPDGHQTAEQIVITALEKGLTHIALTDHYEAQPADPALFPGNNSEAWLIPAADRYRAAIAQSRDNIAAVRALAAGRFSVAAGLELGSPLDDLARTEEILAEYPYDFLLASQHANPGKPDFYYLQQFPDTDLLGEIDRYFDALLAIVQWGRFHSLAHLTYPFRYIPADKRPADTRRWDEKIDVLFRTLAEKGLALEINSAGIRKAIGEPSPTLPLLRRFRERGGELITVGSDAHYPGDVGADIDTVTALASEAGFRFLTRYEQGRPIPERIR